MEFRRRQSRSRAAQSKRVVLVPGSYNPPTHAHRALLEAALDRVDEAVVVLPRAFPHKTWDAAPFEARLCMLEHLSSRPYSIAISEGGLFLEMCAEFQREEPAAEIYIACGRDAAERILAWPYEDPGTLERMFANFQLLVASRRGEFIAPPRFADRIHALAIDDVHDAASSTEVRNRIAAGKPWCHLVPDGVAALAQEVYASGTCP
ncbi:MAG TPA: hypothetical protein VGL53_23495 [Bryobacteraceae bacterium]